MLVWTHRREKNVELLRYVVSMFKDAGVRLFVHRSDMERVGGDVPYEASTVAQIQDEIDFIVSFGSRSPCRSRVSLLFPQACPPVLAFRNRELALDPQVARRVAEQKLTGVFRGEFDAHGRLRFDCTIAKSSPAVRATAHKAMPTWDATDATHYTAVHEVVVHRAPTPIPVHTDLYVDNQYFSEIVADGVILATPSGSRLYSRAAGGALVYPFVQCFQVVPLNPMSLSFRPVILSSNTAITLHRTSRCEQSLLIDGAQARLKRSDIIRICRSLHPLPSIRLWQQPTANLFPSSDINE